MRYATKKEVKELSNAILEMAKQLNDMAKWLAWYKIREAFHNPENKDVFTEEYCKKIVEMSKGHLTYSLFRELFKEILKKKRKRSVVV